MGLFKQKKQSALDEAIDRAEHVFDDAFRDELRKYAHSYFEKMIQENAVLFRQDLDTTITEVYGELKHHITTQLDEQFFKHNEAMKSAQDAALQSLTRSVDGLQQQHQMLSLSLKKSVADEEKNMMGMFDGSDATIKQINDSQSKAIESLNQSVEEVKKQQQELGETLKKNVADQENIMLTAFENNMAQIVEHYLLGALGDQFDLKAQLPSIIHELEENKQAIADDMKL